MALEIDYSGKRVVVTGSGAGIGRSIAVMFAQAGADVVIFDKREDKVQETVEQINASDLGVDTN